MTRAPARIGRSLGSRPLRYLIAGAANTALGLTFYPLLLWIVPFFRTHYMIALGVSQAVCLCFAYLTYKFGVFRTRGNVAREFSIFSGFYLFVYMTNWAALPLLVEVGGIKPWIAQFGFNLVVIVGSYFWHSHVTFRATEPGHGRA